MKKLDKLLSDLQAKGLPVSLASQMKPTLDCIPSGSVLLDHATGIGGYPKGKIVELFGEPSSGKTLLLYAAEAFVTQQGQYVIHCDTEGNNTHAELSQWRDVFGIDRERVIDIGPQCAEDVINALMDFTKTLGEDLGLIGIDSASALTSDKMLEKRAGEGYIPDNPRLVNALCSKLNVVNRHAAVIIINHIMANIGSLSPRPIAKGGNGIKHYAVMRIEVNGKAIVDTTDPFGFAKQHELNMKVVKNKCAPPGGRALRVMFDFDRGSIDTADEMITLAVEKGVIQHQGGGFYVMPNGEKHRGRQTLKDLIYSDKEWYNWFKAVTSGVEA